MKGVINIKLLIVEDEKELLSSIATYFRKNGYAVDTADDGEVAEELIYVENYDLIILDVNLPKIDGFELLKSIRSYDKNINIIMLTARDDILDRVQGFDLGANDYIVKPFHFEELNARVRSHLRRKTILEDSIITLGRLSYDTNKRIAYSDGKEIRLTVKENAILEYLFINRGRYVSQEELLEHAWDDVDPFSNTVRVHMSALRKKLKTNFGENVIDNVLGKGYIINEIKTSK